METWDESMAKINKVWKDQIILEVEQGEEPEEGSITPDTAKFWERLNSKSVAYRTIPWNTSSGTWVFNASQMQFLSEQPIVKTNEVEEDVQDVDFD